MKKINSKSRLARVLSSLEGFQRPKVREEQYLMDGEVGASVLWNAYMLKDIEGKVIADLGCGTGVLGIGARILGARKVILVDSDKKALEIAKNNILKVKSECSTTLSSFEVVCKDVNDFEERVDVVVQNPPFGTKMKHSDVVFLQKAVKIAPVVYSFHKSETKVFLERFSAKNNVKITHIWEFRYPLKSTYPFHQRRIHRINVSCFRFESIN